MSRETAAMRGEKLGASEARPRVGLGCGSFGFARPHRSSCRCSRFTGKRCLQRDAIGTAKSGAWIPSRGRAKGAVVALSYVVKSRGFDGFRVDYRVQETDRLPDLLIDSRYQRGP